MKDAFPNILEGLLICLILGTITGIPLGLILSLIFWDWQIILAAWAGCTIACIFSGGGWS